MELVITVILPAQCTAEAFTSFLLERGVDPGGRGVSISNSVALFKPPDVNEALLRIQEASFEGTPLICEILRRQIPRQRPLRAIVVSRLPRDTSIDEVRTLLRDLEIEPLEGSLRLTGERKDGFYAKLSSEEHARRAVESLNAHDYRGKKVRAHVAH